MFQLSRKIVQNINLAGGSLLGVSRGGASVCDIVDSIQVYHILHYLVGALVLLMVIMFFK